MRNINEYTMRWASSLTASVQDSRICSQSTEKFKMERVCKCCMKWLQFYAYTLVGWCPLDKQTNWSCCGCCKTCWTEAKFLPAAQRISEFEAWWTHHRRGRFHKILFNQNYLKIIKLSDDVSIYACILLLVFYGSNMYFSCVLFTTTTTCLGTDGN